MKIKILFLSLFVSIIAFGQEAYYNNVDLTAEGINLKEKLATKTISHKVSANIINLSSSKVAIEVNRI